MVFNLELALACRYGLVWHHEVISDTFFSQKSWVVGCDGCEVLIIDFDCDFPNPDLRFCNIGISFYVDLEDSGFVAEGEIRNLSVLDRLSWGCFHRHTCKTDALAELFASNCPLESLVRRVIAADRVICSEGAIGQGL